MRRGPSTSLRIQSRILAAHCVRGLLWPCTSKRQRAQGRPGARCTRGLVCNVHSRKRTRAYRFSGSIPAFPAQWLYGLLRALPGEAGSFATVAARIRPRNLTPASGVRTTRFRRTRRATLVSRSSRVHRISLHVRDDRERPSFAVRRAETITDLPDAESGIFLARALDAISTDLPVGQFGASWWQHIRCVPSSLAGEGQGEG